MKRHSHFQDKGFPHTLRRLTQSFCERAPESHSFFSDSFHPHDLLERLFYSPLNCFFFFNDLVPVGSGHHILQPDLGGEGKGIRNKFCFHLNLISWLGIWLKTFVSFSIDKPKALSLLLHTADISHPAKSWDLHHRWTTSLLEEFFRQASGKSQLVCFREGTRRAQVWHPNTLQCCDFSHLVINEAWHLHPTANLDIDVAIRSIDFAVK